MTHGNETSAALNAMADAMQVTYDEYIRSTIIHNGNPDYNELEIEVGAATRDEAATIAVKAMAPALRNHAKFEETRHQETVVPNGEDGGEVRYTVFVREQL